MKSIKHLFSLIPFFISILIAGEKVYIPYFFQEKRTFKLEGQMIYTVAIINNGDVITGTDYGVAIYPHISKDWITISLEDNPVILVASNGRKIAALSGDIKNNLISNAKIYLIQNNKVEKVISLPKDVIIHTQKCDMICAEQIYLGTGEGLYSIQTGPGKNTRII